MSTIDVTTGLIAGLKANGAKVAEYRLHEPLLLAHRLVGYAEDAGETLPPNLPFDMAAGGIPGAALLVEADAVIVVTGRNVPFAVPLALRKGGVATALLCTESPYTTVQYERHDAAAYDYVFTNERTAVPLFDRNPAGRVHYLPHAYNPEVHQPGEAEAAFETDALFVGTGFDERRALFAAVDWAGVRHTLLGPLWDGATDSATIVSNAVPNTEVARRYRSAAICLNHHRTTADWQAGTRIDGAESLGPRAYEIAACGAFQIADWRAEADAVFDGALPFYRDAADLSRLIRFYLQRPDERARLAAAQREAVRPHTWEARAAQVLSVIATRPQVLHFAA